MNQILAFCALSCAAVVFGQSPDGKLVDSVFQTIDAFIKEAGVDKTDANWRTKLKAPPQLSFEKGRPYYWLLQTNKGSMTIEFLPEVAPVHVASAIYLTRLGFYDGLTFHRVIPGFMAQGGCPLGSGAGEPGYAFDGEFKDEVRHDRPGLLSTANRGPNTDGSQFFITFVPTPHLDGKHTIYGRVTDGMDVLSRLASLGSPNGTTRERLVIQKAEVTAGAAPEKSTQAVVDAKASAAPTLKGDPFEAVRQYIADKAIDKKSEQWRERLPVAPILEFPAGMRLDFELETSVGVAKFHLLPEHAPRHVSQLLYLTELGYFDEQPVFRVIPGFMAQFGCPKGTGEGGPGYSILPEIVEGLRHDSRGTLAFVGGEDGKRCSQLYITFGLQPSLDAGNTIVGRLAKGQPMLRALEKVGTLSGVPSDKVQVTGTRVVSR